MPKWPIASASLVGEIKRKKRRRKVGGSVINRCGLIKRRRFFF